LVLIVEQAFGMLYGSLVGCGMGLGKRGMENGWIWSVCGYSTDYVEDFGLFGYNDRRWIGYCGDVMVGKDKRNNLDIRI
jgi:hypothetical protein